MSPDKPAENYSRLALLILPILFLVLGLYYWLHKPVTPSQAAAVASALADAGVALILTLLGGGLGRRLLTAVVGAGPSPLSAGERVAMEAALGWGAMGLAMLGLGLAGAHYRPVIWALAAMTLLAARRGARGWLADLRRAAVELRPAERLSRIAAGFVLLTLALGLLRALAPPLMWDALVYHLTLPRLYAQAHGVNIDVDILFTGMPQQTEMLYTAAMLLRGETAAQTLGWFFGALLALGLAAHAAQVNGPRAAGLAPAVLFSSTTVALSLAWAYADLLLMLMALATLIALRAWRVTGARRWLWAAGAYAGLAVGCKYTGALIPLGGIAIIILTYYASRFTLHAPPSTLHAPPSPLPPPRLLTHALHFALPTGLLFAPWLAKNWLLTGSPTYPFLIPAAYMNPLRQWFYARPDLAERSVLRAAAIFLRAAFVGVQSGNDYDATLGPLFVLLPAGLLLVWRRLAVRARSELAPLVGFALAGYAAWVGLVLLSPLALQTRLFFPIFPALAILCAAAAANFQAFNTPRLRASTVLNAALALTLAFAALEHGLNFAARSPLAYLSGAENALEYRTKHLGWYAVAMDRINSLPVGSRVVFLWETRALPCEPQVRCLPDVVIDRWWSLRRTVGTAEAILSRWKAEGATHVLIFETGLDFARAEPTSVFDPSDWAELADLRSRMRRFEDFGGAYSLYSIAGTQSP